MKIRILHIVLPVFLLISSGVLFAQVDSTGSVYELKRLLDRTRFEQAHTAGADFIGYYSSAGSDIKAKIDDQLELMNTKKIRPYPHRYEYIHSILTAKNEMGLTDDKLVQYLNMTEGVINAYTQSELLQYLKRMTLFFEKLALADRRSHRVYAYSNDFEFEFVGTGPVADPFALIEEEVPQDTVQEEPEEFNWDDWDDTSSSTDSWDSWDDSSWDDTSSDSWDSEPEPEPEPEPVDPLEYLKPQYFPPLINGPVIRFTGLRLNIASASDSIFIENTGGEFLVLENIFAGTGGKLDWEIAGLSKDSVYAELKGFSFNPQKVDLTAIDATLTYTGKLIEPIDGILRYQVHKHDSLRAAKFPRFLSYRATHRVNGLADQNVVYTGGFSLEGAKISSKNFLKDKSVLEIKGLPGKKFIARSLNFTIGDSTFSTPSAEISIIHKRDSIHHPAARMTYQTGSRDLWVDRTHAKYYKSPFMSSYFNMSILGEEIRWNMEGDSMDIYMRRAPDEIPMVFESVDHYEQADFLAMSKELGFNPLFLIAGYAVETGSNEINLGDVAAGTKVSYGKVLLSARMLHDLGLIKYNPKTGNILVSYRAQTIVNAYMGEQDYDDIILESIMDERPDLPNATFFMEDERIEVRGVEYFEMSDSLNVQVEPDSAVITILKNRDIRFDGKITAGNFEYRGKDFTFKYDSFMVNMGTIEEVKFFRTDSLGNRSAADNSMVGLDSASAAVAGIDAGANSTKGTLYLNEPSNKSALINYPNYPNFNAGMGAVVYFDREEIFGGRYDKSMFFVVPPFDIDSLGDSDPNFLQFDGLFASGGMFPVFEEKLMLQPDNSMGFFHDVPEDGYQLYEGSGKLYGDLTMNKQGLRSSGRIDFLSTTLNSDDFIFYPDSVTATGMVAEIREEDHGGVIFPQADLSNFRMRWLPRKDSLYMYNQGDPFQFYNGTAALDGEAIISNNGVYGKGNLITRGSTANSDRLTFNHNSFSARNAEFVVDTSDPEKPALAGNDVRLTFNLEENFATISPEIEGEAAVEFPFAQFKTSIPSARWDLNEQKIYMSKPADVPLENSYFYTTRSDLDSLRFNATDAVYDINTQELKVTGIPYIIVADAKITPENNEVLVLENSQIGTLKNTVIVLDTANAYHRLYDGVIDVKSRNEFSGYATYELVNAVGDTFAIQMTDFRLEEFSEGEGRRSEVVQHTVANGNVAEQENILMSPGMFFKGDVKLEAHRQILQLDGFLKLNLDRANDYDTWIHYKQDANQEIISIDYNSTLTEEGKVLEAGLYFSSLDRGLYPLFIDDPRNIGDEAFFKPSGRLSYDEDNSRFVIEDEGKSTGEKFEGKVFTYDEDEGSVTFEGTVDFMENTRKAEIISSVIGRGSIDTADYQMNSFITFDFDIPGQVWDPMSYNLEQVIQNLGAPEGLGDPTELLYKVAGIMGEQATREYEQATLTEYTTLGGFSKETTKPLVFSDVNLKWSEEHKAFYSEGLLGMSNILSYDINAAWEGFMEFKYLEDGSTSAQMFFKASFDSWYYISYQDNRLMLFSSVEEFNEVVNKRTNAAKAKLGDLVFIPGDRAETLAFINRFRSDYLGIDEEYQLDAEADLSIDKKKEKETDTDDGF